MKRFIVAIILLTQVVVAGAALATPVTLDFSGITNVQDVTIPNPPVTLNGVTISYDNNANGVDYAVIDSAGIFGTTVGSLNLDFSIPATMLALDFSLLDATSASGYGSQISDSLIALFFRNGVFLDSISVAANFFAYDPTADPTLGFATGLLAYTGSAFDQATMFFSMDAPFFTASNVSYEPVPEPATFMLLAVGLLGFSGWRYYGRRC